jgi:hypothetical protein
MVVIQKYDANSNVVHYLWTIYQSLEVGSPYKKLIRNNLWTWFTSKGKLIPIIFKQPNKV